MSKAPRTTTRPSRRTIIAGAGAALAAPAVLRVPGAFAAYPDKPVRIVVANTAGGPSDIIARIVAGALQESTKASFIVENVGGGGGNIGMGRVARADPDGYTLLVSTSSYAVNPSLYATLPYDPVKDFAPIAELATSPNVITVQPDLGVKTLKEFVALARKAPEKFNVTTPPIGTTPNLAAEVLKSREGLSKMATVVHTGGGQALQALLGGSVQLSVGALAPAHALIQSGKLVALAVTGESRWHDLKTVPTMAEAGYKDFVLETYLGFLAPIKTPGEIVALLEKETLAILRNPAMRERLTKSGFTVQAKDGKGHMDRIRREMPMFKKIVADAGIKLPAKK